MQRTSNRPSPRRAFTLVELLVVMTIIAILFALTAAAVTKAMAKADEVKTRNDISQLQSGVQAFKTDFNVAYIPDRLILPPSQDAASLQYITSLWPRLNPNLLTSKAYWAPKSSGQTVTLQGYQTLVFFLGGVLDANNNPIGFSTNPLDPMSTTGATGATNRKGPYFDFPPGRLVVLPSDTPSQMPAFIDVYGTMPYVYFSASKAGNDYNTTYTATGPPSGPGPQFGTTSAGTKFSVLPFQTSSSRFANANGFQIIAAGKDTLFHDAGNTAGGMLWPGYPGGATDLGGYDNMSNFHPTLLGVPVQ